MATSTITNTLTDPTGTAIINCRVTAILHPRRGFRISDGSEIASQVETYTNASGQWSLALERTANIDPASSWYEIIEHDPRKPRHHAIQVGASNASLYASLVSPVTPVTTATYLTQATADARYAPLGTSFATTAESRPNDTASAGSGTDIARANHVHDREITYGTASARAALTGTDLFSGLWFRETDTGRLYTYRASAWVQVVDDILVADAAARAAISNPYEGMKVTELDTELEYRYDGVAWAISDTHGQWVAWTPSFTQSNTGLTGTVQHARYKKEGRSVTASFHKAFATGTLGVAGNAIFITAASLPATPAAIHQTTVYITACGIGFFKLAGSQYVTSLAFGLGSDGRVGFLRADAVVSNWFGIDPNAAVANADFVGATFTYEANA